MYEIPSPKRVIALHKPWFQMTFHFSKYFVTPHVPEGLTLQIGTMVSFTRVWKTLDVQPYLWSLDNSNEEPHKYLFEKGLKIYRPKKNQKL